MKKFSSRKILGLGIILGSIVFSISLTTGALSSFWNIAEAYTKSEVYAIFNPPFNNSSGISSVACSSLGRDVTFTWHIDGYREQRIDAGSDPFSGGSLGSIPVTCKKIALLINGVRVKDLDCSGTYTWTNADPNFTYEFAVRQGTYPECTGPSGPNRCDTIVIKNVTIPDSFLIAYNGFNANYSAPIFSMPTCESQSPTPDLVTYNNQIRARYTTQDTTIAPNSPPIPFLEGAINADYSEALAGLDMRNQLNWNSLNSGLTIPVGAWIQFNAQVRNGGGVISGVSNAWFCVDGVESDCKNGTTAIKRYNYRSLNSTDLAYKRIAVPSLGVGTVGDQLYSVFLKADNRGLYGGPPLSAGQHKVYFCVDTGNSVSEFDENNNCTVQNFTVVDMLLDVVCVPHGEGNAPGAVGEIGYLNEPTSGYIYAPSTWNAFTLGGSCGGQYKYSWSANDKFGSPNASFYTSRNESRVNVLYSDPGTYNMDVKVSCGSEEKVISCTPHRVFQATFKIWRFPEDSVINLNIHTNPSKQLRVDYDPDGFEGNIPPYSIYDVGATKYFTWRAVDVLTGETSTSPVLVSDSGVLTAVKKGEARIEVIFRINFDFVGEPFNSGVVVASAVVNVDDSEAPPPPLSDEINLRPENIFYNNLLIKDKPQVPIGFNLTFAANILREGKKVAVPMIARFCLDSSYEDCFRKSNEEASNEILAPINVGGGIGGLNNPNRTARVTAPRNWTSTLGTHSIMVCIDPEQRNKETAANLTDNCLAQEIEVIAPGPSLVADCRVSDDEVVVDEEVIWTAQGISGSCFGPYTYLWGGDSSVSGRTTESVTTSFSVPGSHTPTVRVSCGAQSELVSCTRVNVLGPTLEIYPNEATLKIGDSQSFSAYFDADGPSGQASVVEVTFDSDWRSDNSSIFNIGSNGTGDGLTIGSTKVHASYEINPGNLIEASANVNVITNLLPPDSPIPPVIVTLKSTPAVINKGQSTVINFSVNNCGTIGNCSCVLNEGRLGSLGGQINLFIPITADPYSSLVGKQERITPNETKYYTLTCANDAGSESKETRVIVGVVNQN